MISKPTMIYIGLFLLICSSVQCGRSFSETYTVDHTYYTMSLYQDNAQGMYDKHFVDMSNSQVRISRNSFHDSLFPLILLL